MAVTQACNARQEELKTEYYELADPPPLRLTTTYVHGSGSLTRFHSPLCLKEHVELIPSGFVNHPTQSSSVALSAADDALAENHHLWLSSAVSFKSAQLGPP